MNGYYENGELFFEFAGKKCHFEQTEQEDPNSMFMPPMIIVDEEGNVLATDVIITGKEFDLVSSSGSVVMEKETLQFEPLFPAQPQAKKE